MKGLSFDGSFLVNLMLKSEWHCLLSMTTRRMTSRFGPPGSTHLRVWVRSRNSSNVRILKAGHLVGFS